ncbi:nitroreductase family protein [Paenibacillus senegalensis]|uniref:hypothetical protein n=1 Tax=Paenibacillus senegalensis TaxID=1465766 RepID=UPI0011DDB061|nr:hypothetical protein [Paenibacillus senegalensis]
MSSAVWAPNDGLREPWRFLYIDGAYTAQALPEHEAAPAHLVVIAHQRKSSHIQEEDLCAVYGLIQNLRLLIREHGLATRIAIEEWMYGQAARLRLGIADDERIAAVMDMGYVSEFARNKSTRLRMDSLK